MTAMELCGNQDDVILFTIGKSKVVWEAISYRDSCDKCYISRITQANEGGKSFLLGLCYRSRYISPDTIVNLVTNNDETGI